MTVEAATESGGPDVLDVNSLLNAAEADEQPEPETEEAPPAAEKPKAPAAKAPPSKAAPAAPAKPAPAPPQAEPAEADDLSDLLAEGVTFTPETVKKGAARVVAQAKAAQELTTKAHKVWGTAEKHARKVKEDRETVQRERQMFGAQVQQMNAAFNAMRTGDAKTALEGIRQLTGQDPVTWLESLNIHIASNGKKKPKSSEVQELEARLERFEQAERARAQQNEEAQAQAFIVQRYQELTTLATESAETHPHVAEFALENPETIGEALAQIIVRSARAGRKVADAEALRMLEEQLEHQSELSERARQKREKRAADSGSEHGTGNPSKPGTAQAPTVKGKSLSTSAITAPSVKRELTDEELEEDSANFLPPALLNWSRGMS
jgi:hypothetical protein